MCSIIRSNSTKCYCNSVTTATTTKATTITRRTKKTLTTLSSLSSLLSISNGIGTNRRLFIILFITIGLLSSTIDGRRSRPQPSSSSSSGSSAASNANNHDLDVEYLEEIEEDDFDCPEKFGYYPDVTNCSRYHICDHGKSALKSCDDGLVFSTVLKTCDWPYNVHCNLANGDRGDFIGTHLRLREDGENDLSLGNRRQPVLTNEADDSYWLGKPDTDFLAYLNDEEDYHDHYSPNDQEFDIPRRKPLRQPEPNRSPDEPAEEDEANVGVAVNPNQPWFESFEHARRRNQNNQRPANPVPTTTPKSSSAPVLSQNQRGTTGWRSRNRPVNNPTPSTTPSTTQATPPTPLLPRRALRIGHNPDLNDQDHDYLLTDDPGNALINDDDGDYNRRQTLKDDRDSYRIVSHNRHSPTTTQAPPTTAAAITLPPRLPPWTKPPPAIQSQPQSHFPTTPPPTGVLIGSQPRHLGTSVRRKLVRKKIVAPKSQPQSYTTPAPLTTTVTPTTIATTSAPWNSNNNFWNSNNNNQNNNNNNNKNDPWNAFRYETINRNNSNTNTFNNQNGPHKISSIRRTVPKLNNQQRFERKPVLRDDHEADLEDHSPTRGHNDAEDESYFYNTPDIIRHRSAAGLNTSVVVNDLLPKNVVKDVSNNLNNGRYSSGRGNSQNSNSRPAPVPPANTNNQFLNKAFDLGFHHAINPLNQGVPRAPFTGGASHDIEYEDLENEDEDENVEEANDDDDESNNNVNVPNNVSNNPGSGGGRQPLNKEIIVRYDDDETDDSIGSINDPRRQNPNQNLHHQNQTISRFVSSTPRRTTPTPLPARYTRFIDGTAATLAPGNNNNNFNNNIQPTNGTNNNKKLNSAIRFLDITAPENHLQDLAPILAPARIHHHDEPHDRLPNPVPFVTIIGPLKKNNRNYNPKINNHNHNNIYNIPAQPQSLPISGGQRSVLQPSLLPPLPQIPGGSQLFSGNSNNNNHNNNNNSPWTSGGKPVGTSNKKVKKNKQVKVHKSPKSTSNPKSMKNMFYQRAKRCSPEKCQLPNCFCGGTNIPGGYQPKEIPQIVLLTFDDSVNDLNRDIYRRLFEQGRTNPNGCPISATFYVSHEWTDYSQVQNLYAKGHEIASHSISFGEKFSKERWLDEILGQKEILSLYGGVDKHEIRGMRAPFLQTGGDTMFEMLHQANFSYDSSLPVYDIDPPYWPYTLDFAIGHDCMIEPCPSNSYPGFWEVGMVMWEDLRGGRCSMADGCFNPSDEQGVYEMVKQNFLRHYTSNRAPFGMYFHSRWFLTEHNMKGFIRFLDEMLQMDDIYLVTNYQMIQWMQHPTPLSRVKQFKPFGCDYIQQRPPLCKAPHTCKARFRGEIRTLKTCQQCPTTYPWTGNNGHE